MIEPLRFNLTVACSPDHAFRTWTERASSWWPPEHTLTHDPKAVIVFEARVGGRIFERTSTRQVVEWGRVTAWEPPHRLAYSWHIATDPGSATDVEIRFEPAASGRTGITIEHSGWERLAERGPGWRVTNRGGWDGVLPAYAKACNA